MSDTVTIGLCDVDTIRDHAADLLEAHWGEVAQYKHLMVLKPDWHRYYEAEEKGMLLAISVGVPGNPMVGYSVSFIGSHMHYRDLVVATNDVLFLHEGWRTSGVGPRLIVATEAEAAERGAKLMLWHAKPDTALDSIMPRMGYSVIDIVHSKEL